MLRKLLFSPIGAICLTIIVGIVAWSLVKPHPTTQTSTEVLQVLDQEVAQLARQVSDVERQANASQSALAQEKILRNELLLQKPGEWILQLPPDPSPSPLPSPTPTPPPVEVWRKTMGWQ